MKNQVIKKSIACLLAVCSVTSLVSFGGCGKAEVLYTPSDDLTSYIVSGVNNGGSLKELSIPAERDGLPVTAIAPTAFSGCTRLEKLEMTDSITKIGYSAFAFCSSLTSVTLSQSLTELPLGVFAYCSALSHVELPQNLQKIGDKAFQNTALVEVDIPSTVTSIGAFTFMDCRWLKDIFIPISVQELSCTFKVSKYYNDSSNSMITGYYRDPAENRIRYEGTAQQFKTILKDYIVYTDETNKEKDERKTYYAEKLIELAPNGVVLYEQTK